MLAASYGNQGSRRDEERREITMCLNSRLFARVSLDFMLELRRELIKVNRGCEDILKWILDHRSARIISGWFSVNKWIVRRLLLNRVVLLVGNREANIYFLSEVGELSKINSKH